MVTPMPKRRRRYSRRKGLGALAFNRRWRTLSGMAALTLIAGFVAVVAVQVGPAERIYVRSIDSSFAASVTPIAQESNDTANELASMLGGADAKLGSALLVATVDSMVGDANESVHQFEMLSTPSNLTAAASSCLSALQSRARVLEAFRSSVATLVTGSVTDQIGPARAGTAQAETSIEHLGVDLSGADESWSRCRDAMLEAPGRGLNSVPPSVWVGAETAWQAPTMISFIDDLTQSAPTVTVEPLAIAAVSCDPPAVVTRGGIDELPMATSLSVHVVVFDQNHGEESDVVATVSLEPLGAAGRPDTVSSEASIGPGQAFSFHPPPLTVTPGATYRVEVIVTGPGQNPPSRRIYRISVGSDSGAAKS